MSLKATRAKLRKAAARLQGHKDELERAEGELHGRVREQLDTLGPVHDAVAEYVGQGKGGGILGQRRLRTLQKERARLLDLESRGKP